MNPISFQIIRFSPYFLMLRCWIMAKEMAIIGFLSEPETPYLPPNLNPTSRMNLWVVEAKDGKLDMPLPFS